MSETTQVLTVRSLLCHHHVDMALVCLGSLLKFSPTPLQLVIHDDGSLTTEDVERLTTQLPGTKVLSRKEADDLVNGLLKNHPYAYEYRQEAPLALKLLDMPLLNKGDLAYCDSDVLFFHTFKGVFDWEHSDESAKFMMDRFSSYSIHSQGLKKLNGIGLLGKVNSGLFFLREGTYDLDFIERCLSNEGFRSGKVWLIEQTTWAAVASRLNGTLYNPQQVAVVESERTITDDLIAGHFVTRARPLLGKFSPQAAAGEVGQPQVVTSIPPRECTFFDLAYTELRTHLRRTNRKISEKFMALMPLSK